MDEQWELHKSTIQRLYLREDNTLKAVMEFMKRTHNFQQT